MQNIKDFITVMNNKSFGADVVQSKPKDVLSEIMVLLGQYYEINKDDESCNKRNTNLLLKDQKDIKFRMTIDHRVPEDVLMDADRVQQMLFAFVSHTLARTQSVTTVSFNCDLYHGMTRERSDND